MVVFRWQINRKENSRQDDQESWTTQDQITVCLLSYEKIDYCMCNKTDLQKQLKNCHIYYIILKLSS